jgi:hypothetical protein
VASIRGCNHVSSSIIPNFLFDEHKYEVVDRIMVILV